MIKMRDLNVIFSINKYITQMKLTLGEFNDDFERFKKSHTFYNAVSMCLLQIGELTAKLSDEFKEQNTDIKWNKIKGLRNVLAHDYESIEHQII